MHLSLLLAYCAAACAAAFSGAARVASAKPAAARAHSSPSGGAAPDATGGAPLFASGAGGPLFESDAGGSPLFPNGAPAPLGPNGPSEYQLNLGRAIDTLRVDHPRLFTHPPDLSIFTEGVTLQHDASGNRLRGIAQYERVFGMLRFLRRAAQEQRPVRSGWW